MNFALIKSFKNLTYFISIYSNNYKCNLNKISGSQMTLKYKKYLINKLEKITLTYQWIFEKNKKNIISRKSF